MRKILFMMALALMVACAPTQATAQEPYNPDYKANFFPTGWSIGVAGDFTKTQDMHEWTYGDGYSIGAQVRATKRIGTVWNLRYIADVPGIVTRRDQSTGEPGFDRYGKALSGISLNFLDKAYLFTDAGLTWNPSTSSRKVGIAGQVGLGLNFDFGFDDYNYNRFFVEIGVDRHNNSTYSDPLPADFKNWSSNVFATVGYTHTLGLAEKDRQKLNILRNQPKTIERLKEENRELNELTMKQSKAVSECTEALNRSTALSERLDRELNECRSQQEQSQDNTNGCETFQIYFQKSSAVLSDIEIEKVMVIVQKMKNDGGNYAVDGYSSASGSDEFNLELSQKRAEAVYRVIDRMGAGHQVVSVEGHGKTNVYNEGTSSLNQMVTITRK